MIDFHTHVLNGVDDGSKDLEMSLRMLEGSSNEKVEYICSTPHFIPGEYEIEKADYDKGIDILIEKNKYSVKIITGLEVYIHPELPELYKAKRIWGLNNSSYMLIELPMQNYPIYTEKVFYKLRLEGITPIIAHPERNLNILKDRELLKNLVEQGTLVQMNAGSLLGMNGEKIKKFSEALVENNLVHILGSDAHNDSTRPTKLAQGYSKIKSLNPLLYEWILENENNILCNLEVEVLDIHDVNEKRRSIFNFFRK